ncbi:MAG: flagellar type III secretion system protein FlhB [Pseudomonadota bacterium]|uniref:Flagellar biosynthesis protein FlhB n=1 Tax=Sphingobium xenophagum TaxID=121428 RepID=A0A249MQC1_SPHXE|nr:MULTISPECIES: flagellar type III secretion system protein FlhB [Sphingobium]ASY43550.1 flagellar biosynthesis protein FlhB [Sphingobium xenophagum]MBG6117767.1 flagellar biosynthetic protein FlhB [Sphingobium sp. JAI105]OUC55520.1 flagellar biosynthesis protein FlhB [Sphingobium sp. GW456-12-10-14-TSB1]PSO12390.1 flagellar biosynthesis protein FlhB [Sphingobium sp. AEW4]QWT13322.1 flagellar type III secretion system protein FlhB [Sphingobium xenophagum]|tara:strand:- start:2313 stop:3449 length:1137 start_codon:yes stop_codon:yes gene_type:complete
MADSPGGGEKTEKPTPKKLQDAAKKGDILQSRELGTALVVMAGIGWLAVTGPSMIDALSDMLTQALRFRRDDIVDFSPAERGLDLLTGIALPVAGVMLATFLAAIAAPALLGSLGFRPGAFAPKASKLNPGAGLKRIFGTQGLIELLKSIAKVGLLGSIGVWMIWDRLTAIIGLGKQGIAPAMADLGNMFILTCLVMAGGLFLIAGIDVPAQIMQRAKRLGMSKQEIKDEHKESEGSPELKGQIRRRQYETLNGSTRQAVAEASVIITNPTHFAVALRYKPGVDAAPVVVARGSDAIAAAIRELADQNGVTVLQYPELARAIYFTSRTGQIVNEGLYMAVATVLAFVFRVENRMASEMDRPFITVPEDLRFDADGKKH